METGTNEKIHQGRNVKRFREMLGIKQEAFATELGEDWNQKKVSLLEQKETIEDDLLQQVAKVLKVPVEAIKNFDKETALNIFSNTYTNNDNSATVQGYIVNYNPSFNPIDKIVELYEALVKSEKEKVELLERILNEKK